MLRGLVFYSIALVSPVVCRAQSAPDSADLQQAVELHQSGNYTGAIDAYQRFLKVHPEAAMVRSNLGAALAHEGRFEEAIREYTLALSVDPRNQAVRLNLALAYYKSGDIAQAIEHLERVHEAEPKNMQAAELLGSCYLAAGQNAKVIALLDPMVSVSTDDLGAVYLMGTALVRDHQTERGQVWLDRILSKGDTAEAHLLIGTAKLMVNEISAARVDLEKAVELNPKLPGVHSYLALALLRSADTVQAAVEFRKELANDPNDFEANLQLGGLLRQEDHLDEARSLIERALAIRAGDFAARYQIATIDILEGKIEAARKGLESIVKEAPEFTEAHVSLATVYYRLKLKDDGDRERDIVKKLNAAQQARQKRPQEEPAKP
jgi:Flp pilus assembly protein TadD